MAELTGDGATKRNTQLVLDELAAAGLSSASTPRMPRTTGWPGRTRSRNCSRLTERWALSLLPL
ncbi:MAG: hypothetical protein K8W52_16215 [Deltaproteobacteria bacterium]|nr:hypothetical protein [Deltaproteobacteria bacterium]